MMFAWTPCAVSASRRVWKMSICATLTMHNDNNAQCQSGRPSCERHHVVNRRPQMARTKHSGLLKQAETPSAHRSH